MIVIRFDSPVALDELKQALKELTLAVPRMRANIVPTWRTYKLAVRPHDEWLDELIDQAVTTLSHVDPDDAQAMAALQTQLLNDIWGPSHKEDTHYLRIVIASLRKKLGDNPQQPSLIETESGIGYRFIGS